MRKVEKFDDLLNKYPNFKSNNWEKLTKEEKKLVFNWVIKNSKKEESNQKKINLNVDKKIKRKRILRPKKTSLRLISRENRELKIALSKIGIWIEASKKPKKKKRVKIKSKSKSKIYYDKTTSSVRSISTPMGNKR